MTFFTVDERERVCDRVLALAATVAGLLREAGALGVAVEPQLRAVSERR